MALLYSQQLLKVQQVGQTFELTDSPVLSSAALPPCSAVRLRLTVAVQEERGCASVRRGTASTKEK
jgi:hypothetical protein